MNKYDMIKIGPDIWLDIVGCAGNLCTRRDICVQNEIIALIPSAFSGANHFYKNMDFTRGYIKHMNVLIFYVKSVQPKVLSLELCAYFKLSLTMTST